MQKVKLVAVAAVLLAGVVGVISLSLATPALADCEPVACPAIAKICPQGQIACHPSPCSCALACVPDQGHGCDF
jgi:hypothetical protein